MYVRFCKIQVCKNVKIDVHFCKIQAGNPMYISIYTVSNFLKYSLFAASVFGVALIEYTGFELKI